MTLQLFKSSKLKKGRGQALVEMALITSILLIMLIGIFEVGYMLWGYMNLVNLNREVARYAARPDVLKFEDVFPADPKFDGQPELYAHAVGFTKLYTYITEISQNSNLSLRFEADPSDPGLITNTTMIISHFVVDTQQPCTGTNCFDDLDRCKADSYTLDDLAIHPDLSGYDYLRYTYGPTVTTRLDSTAIIRDMLAFNNEMNCQLKVDNINDNSVNSSIIIEMFYEQPQLLGFPIATLLLPNPATLYAQTVFRLDTADSGLCDIVPLVLYNRNASPVEDNWVVWNPSTLSPPDKVAYVRNAVHEPRFAANDFGGRPGTLRIGSFVTLVRNPSLLDALQIWLGARVVVPVVQGSQISEFQRVQIRSINFTDNEVILGGHETVSLPNPVRCY